MIARASVAFMLGLTFASVAAAPDRHLDVVVDISLKRGVGAADLEVTLTNREDKTIKLYRSSLPWGNVYSMVIVGVELDGSNETLDSGPIIDDAGPDSVLVQPHATTVGSINLLKRLPRLQEALEKSDVVVFWSYQLKTIDGEVSERTGGSVVLSGLRRLPSGER